jgi:hypothetical protein
MWRVGNKGACMLPPGRLFHVGFPGRNLMIIQYHPPTDHLGYPPPLEQVLYVLEPREGVI